MLPTVCSSLKQKYVLSQPGQWLHKHSGIAVSHPGWKTSEPLVHCFPDILYVLLPDPDTQDHNAEIRPVIPPIWLCGNKNLQYSFLFYIACEIDADTV